MAPSEPSAPAVLGSEDFEVEVRTVNLSVSSGLSYPLKRRNGIDRVELLDGVRIDITASQRCKALLGQLRIVADIAEQFLVQRPKRRAHCIDLTIEDVTGHAVAEHSTQQILFIERRIHQG
jgi:hypothetical protein